MDGGVLHYQIQWQGYAEKSWEPISNLDNVMFMVDDFEKELERRKKEEIENNKKQK